MSKKLEILIRSCRELSETGNFYSVEDPKGLLQYSPAKVKSYRENPYLDNIDKPCQLIAIMDGKVVGRRDSIPSRIVADGKVYRTRISGAVYVIPSARSSMCAIKLLARALELEDGELNINCMLSKQNQKFYEFMGSAMFKIEEFECGGKWNRFYKAGEYVGVKKLAASIINACVNLANLFCKSIWIGLPNWSVREIDATDSAFADRASELIKQDAHRYRAEITPEWIGWTLKNDFSAPNCRKFAIGIYEQNTFVGFALVRQDNKYKVSRVFEWQLDAHYASMEGEFLSVVARHLVRFGYKINISVDSTSLSTINYLRNRFFIKGQNYVVVTIAEGSKFEGFDGTKESNSWRIRPGMGDAAFW